jgi:hypothetical protein
MPGRTHAEVLRIGPGSLLWFSPAEWLHVLGPLPPGVRMTGAFAGSTVAIVFVSNPDTVGWFLRQHGSVIGRPPMVWMCYPTRGRMDMSRPRLLQLLAGHAVHPVEELVIDGSWSAMRLRPLGAPR